MADVRECPSCQSNQGRVVDSREQNGYIKRRHECLKCSTRWNSFEMAESEYNELKQVKKLIPLHRALVKLYRK